MIEYEDDGRVIRIGEDGWVLTAFADRSISINRSGTYVNFSMSADEWEELIEYMLIRLKESKA